MFTTYPTYPKFRALKLTTPRATGEDVWALQSALIDVGQLKVASPTGSFGDLTDKAVRSYQQTKAASDPTIGDADGIAGSLTQRALTLDLCRTVSMETGVRFLALKGQTEHESGFRPGIYSELHNPGTDIESWDSGVVQENSRVFEVQRAFSPLAAINDLCDRIIEHRDHFTEIKDGNRRLQLAQGTWNAPAWACFIAYEEGARNAWVKARKSRTLSSGQRATIETYMAHVATYYI